MFFVSLWPCRCVLIREVSSFQRVKMWSLLTWGLTDVSSLERCLYLSVTFQFFVDKLETSQMCPPLKKHHLDVYYAMYICLYRKILASDWLHKQLWLAHVLMKPQLYAIKVGPPPSFHLEGFHEVILAIRCALNKQNK